MEPKELRKIMREDGVPMCEEEYLDVVTFMVEQGADMENNCSGRGGHPIDTLYRHTSSCSTAHILLLHHSHPRSGMTALNAAATVGFLPCVQYLKNASADFCKMDKIGHSPLHNAVEAGHLEVVESLISFGADVHQKTLSGRSLIDLTSLESIKQAIRDAGSENIDG